MKKKRHYFDKPQNIYLHVTRNTLVGLLLIIIMLIIGMAGYYTFENMSLADSFLNASMILSGMGPASQLMTTNGKIFAGIYALFSGLAFIAIVVIILSPVIHRFFQKIHIEAKNADTDDS